MNKWIIWSRIVAVFISGMIIGSVVTGFYVKHRMSGIIHRGPQAVKNVIMKKLTAELDLTENQQDDIEEIVEETQLKLQQLRAQYRPQMEEIISTGIANMKTNLSPEQQKKLDALYEKMKMRWRVKSKQRDAQ